MALFTDTNIVTESDLVTYESSLDSVATSQRINVQTKIELATSAIGDKLLLWLSNVGTSDPQWLNRRLLGLSTVVVTSPLHRWLCFDALSRFFAEAYSLQLNTRFQAKLAEYQQEAKQAANAYFLSGTGIVYNPLPRPSVPLVSIQTGTIPAQAMFIQTAWVDSLGEESALSPVNGVVLTDNSGAAAAMAEGALKAPPGAAGWNIYASSSQSGLTRQNSSPLAVGSTWEMPSSGLIQGPDPIGGQRPNFYITLSRQIRRG
ncbi:MAG: hypothetical protein JOY54_19005 [Acidobacteriaceae bacterium]|nr:hypothetical protein [Acidobacteriaceae bacterium]